MKGNCFIVRFADDFVAGFTLRTDAERVYQVLPKRFERYGLAIHPEKSRMVQFSRPYWRRGKGPGSFAFLGFTHYWAKTRQDGWTIKRKMLEVACEHTEVMWQRWLRRRNSKDRMSWAGFAARVKEIFELPQPRIVHAF